MRSKRSSGKAGFSAERPYERMDAMGADKLTDAELLAILLHTGDGTGDATELGRRLLTGGDPSASPSLSVLYGMTFRDLTKIRGIGRVKARRILALMELSVRLSQEKCLPKPVFRSAEQVFDYYRPRLTHEKREKLILITLNLRLAIIGEHLLSAGTINATLFSTREVFETALADGATSIILIHNHPSGDPAPSSYDRECTDRIEKAGYLMGIPLTDHIIIGSSYYSFREDGKIQYSPDIRPERTGELSS